MLSAANMEPRVLADGNTARRRPLMPETFNVTLVIEDLELSDDNLDRLFDALPDAVPADIAGLVTVESPVDADTAEGAAFALIDTITDLFPEALPCRLDQDLVAIPDIASRADRSRESVRLLVDGKRGPGSFPPPVGTVGDGIRVWPWAVVVDWFAEALGEEIDDPGIPPQVASVVDACLAARRHRLAHRQTVVWHSGSGGARKLAVTAADTKSRYVLSA